MICPDCGHDNISGVDECDACGQPLVSFDPAGSELEQSITRHAIDVLVPKSPVTVEASTTLREAVTSMVENHIGCLLVIDDGQLAGVVTERDVLMNASTETAEYNRPVSDFMTPSPQTIRSEDSIAYALHAMDLGGYRHMPIVDDSGQPTGIISIRDILRFLCVRFAESRATAE